MDNNVVTKDKREHAAERTTVLGHDNKRRKRTIVVEDLPQENKKLCGESSVLLFALPTTWHCGISL